MTIGRGQLSRIGVDDDGVGRMVPDGIVELAGIGDLGDDLVSQPFQRHAQEQGAFRVFVVEHDFHAGSSRKIRTRKQEPESVVTAPDSVP
jgi:hypothetical protein